LKGKDVFCCFCYFRNHLRFLIGNTINHPAARNATANNNATIPVSPYRSCR
jgi:hypothetical protein